MRALCVLDGDCDQQVVGRWLDSETAGIDEHRVGYIILPGASSPEKWIADQLRFEDYEDAFARQFDCSRAEASGHIQAMNIQLDVHNIGHCLFLRTNIEANDCIRRTMRSVAPIHPQLEELRERVAQEL